MAVSAWESRSAFLWVLGCALAPWQVYAYALAFGSPWATASASLWAVVLVCWSAALSACE